MLMTQSLIQTNGLLGLHGVHEISRPVVVTKKLYVSMTITGGAERLGESRSSQERGKATTLSDWVPVVWEVTAPSRFGGQTTYVSLESIRAKGTGPK